MRIDKVAGVATASFPLYLRSFNETISQNGTSVKAISSVTTSSTTASKLSSSSAIAGDKTSTTATTEEVTLAAFGQASTTSSSSVSVHDGVLVSANLNATESLESTSSISSSSRSTFSTTSSSLVSSSTSATPPTNAVSPALKLSNATTTAVEVEEVTQTATRNTTVSETSLMNGTLTRVTTEELVLHTLSANASLAATATPLPSLLSASGSTQACASYYIAQKGDSCSSIASLFSITVNDFKGSNPSIKACDGLTTGATYCVSTQIGVSASSASNSTVQNSTILASTSSKALNTHFALLGGSTVVIAEITSTLEASGAGSVHASASATLSRANSSTTATQSAQISSSSTSSALAFKKLFAAAGSGSALETSVLTSASTASSVKALSATTQTITRVTTKTDYVTIDHTSTKHVTSTVYEVTVTETVTKYVTASMRALAVLAAQSSLASSACGTAKTTVVTLPASKSPTIVATPGVSRSSSASSTSAGSKQTSTIGTSVKFCPNLNNTVYTDGQGKKHAIYCNMSFKGTIISTASSVKVKRSDDTTLSGKVIDETARTLRKRATPTNLGQCIDQCNAMTSCVGAAFSGSTCTYYSSVNSTPYAASGVRFAKVVSTVTSSTKATAATTSKSASVSEAASTSKSSSKASTISSKAASSSVKSSSKVSTSSSKMTSSVTKLSSTVSKTSSKASTTSSKATTSVVKSSSTTSKKTSTFATSTKSATSTCKAVTAPAPTQTGIVSGCSQYYVAQSGDYCYLIASKYNIDVDTFMTWNPAVNAPSCNNIQIGDAYCVAVGGCSGSGSSSTLTSSAGTSTKTTTSTTSTSTAVAYKMYSGNGTVAAGWPAMTEWKDFDTLFALNQPNMLQSCLNNWNVPNDSASEIAQLKSAILSVSSATGVDAHFILSIVMQESNGCVRVITTNYGVTNPGLMQSHNGNGTCNKDGVVQTPCPEAEIIQMVEDGTAGTADGDGLQQVLTQTGSPAGDVARYYRAARIYNGGAGGYNKDDLGKGCCTLCYSSDVANRLRGWSTGNSGCTL